MTKQPFMPLFFGDLLAATSEWEGEEVSLYLTLLGHQWALGDLPADPTKLCRIVRWDRKLFDRCWKQVSVKFQQRGDRLTNERLELHRAKSKDLSEKNSSSGKKGAEARWRNHGERHRNATSGAQIANAIKAPVANGHGVTPLASRMAIHPIRKNEEEESEASQGEEGGSSY